MLSRLGEPIAAIATAPGRAAVGIVRVSGTALDDVIHAVCGRGLAPREVTYLPFRSADGSPIDRGLALFFPAPHSYTGEDVLELQAHGGPVVLHLLLARCLEAGASIGLRVAEPGEFTRRAFLNGKMDLAQAEAVADLIDASTEAAARGAVRSIEGVFSSEVRTIAEQLLKLRMLVEATLDFPEEEIDFLERDDAQGQLENVRALLRRLSETSRQGALLREGIKVVIAGQPNAGKSSLLNALAGFERAIVTPIAGTTRDVLTESIQIDGVPLHVIDTAGLRVSDDEVERLGIDRAWGEIEGADVLLFLRDMALRDDAAYREADALIEARLRDTGLPILHVWNKLDLIPPPRPTLPAGAIELSARTGEGLSALRASLLAVVGLATVPEGLHLARARHVHALSRAATHLASAERYLISRPPPLELFAEELRLGHAALGEITGQISADALLGEIFRSFCIGK